MEPPLLSNNKVCITNFVAHLVYFVRSCNLVAEQSRTICTPGLGRQRQRQLDRRAILGWLLSDSGEGAHIHPADRQALHQRVICLAYHPFLALGVSVDCEGLARRGPPHRWCLAPDPHRPVLVTLRVRGIVAQ